MRRIFSLFLITAIYATQSYSENFSCEIIQKNGSKITIPANLTDSNLSRLSNNEKQSYANIALAITVCPKAGYPNKGALVSPLGIRASSNVKQFQEFQDPRCQPKCTSG